MIELRGDRNQNINDVTSRYYKLLTKDKCSLANDKHSKYANGIYYFCGDLRLSFSAFN